MVTLGFFSLTTDERLKMAWKKDDIWVLRALLREAVYMRHGSTTIPPQGFTFEIVQELRTIIDNMAKERYGDSSEKSISKIKEYFSSEIDICDSLI